MNARDKSFRQKLIYLGAIIVLLGLIGWIGRPASRGGEGGMLAKMRTDHGLSQSHIGEIDAASETIKLASLGLRGVGTIILWEKANEYKKKKDWVNLRATIERGGERISLYAVHLHPPVSIEWANWREMELAGLAEYLEEGPEPRVVVGDLNLTPFSPVFGDFLARTGLDDARRAQGIHVTWPTYPLPVWIPIDHCLADAALPIISVHRGPDVGSDHYPLEVTIAVPH